MNELESREFEATLLICRWKKMLGKALNAAEVVTFDYPCEFLGQLVLTFAFSLSLLSLLKKHMPFSLYQIFLVF